MTDYTLYGRVVTPECVIENGAVTVRGDVIEFVGEKDCLSEAVGTVFDCTGCLILPGFVDIHCHAAPSAWAYEDPVSVAEYHNAHGTTSLLCTYYRDIPLEKVGECLGCLKEVMKTVPTVKGAHLEGPYLNPRFGTGKLDEGEKVNPEEYIPIADSGIIRQWTYAPEVPGTDVFARDIAKRGIVPAIGHSSAAPDEVKRAESDGARIVTHLFDATGYAQDPPLYDGTIEASFNTASLICDNFYYEIILDSERVHVRSELLHLAVKAVGVDRIIGITDSCAGGDDDDGRDINVVNGELYGSRLTMDRVFANFVDEGFTLSEVTKITALNPAEAVGLEATGALKVGYYADIVVTDNDFKIKKVFTATR